MALEEGSETAEELLMKRVGDDIVAHTFTIFPNPTEDVLYINPVGTTLIASVKIYDDQGRIVHNRSHGLYNQDVSTILSWDTSGLVPGCYLVVVQSEDAVESARFIKNP
jgi:hypothetical protein